MRRDLFVTLEMLQRDGLTADARLAHGLIEVRLDHHRAMFPASKAAKAADWLAETTVMNHPESEFSKLWLLLAKAAGGAIPFGSRQ
jgi:hypothetical protein